MLLAAVALGFNGMWKTGSAAYDDTVKVALGLRASDAIVGFMYLGTEVAPAAAPAPAPWGELVSDWEPAP
jgi:nitroreductase